MCHLLRGTHGLARLSSTQQWHGASVGIGCPPTLVCAVVTLGEMGTCSWQFHSGTWGLSVVTQCVMERCKSCARELPARHIALLHSPYSLSATSGLSEHL